MLFSCRGIVFRNQKYKDSSVLLDIYTDTHGLLTFIAHGVRKAKARTSPSSVQLMSIVELSGYYKPGRSIQKVKEIKPHYVYKALPFDVLKSAVGTFITEVSRKCIKEESANEELFSFLSNIFKQLDELEEGLSVFHLNFLVELGHYLGILPYLELSTIKEGYLDMLDGVLVDLPPFHGNYLDAADSQLFQRGLGGVPHGEWPAAQRRAFIQLMLRYYSIHIPNMGKINSHVILETILT